MVVARRHISFSRVRSIKCAGSLWRRRRMMSDIMAGSAVLESTRPQLFHSSHRIASHRSASHWQGSRLSCRLARPLSKARYLISCASVRDRRLPASPHSGRAKCESEEESRRLELTRGVYPSSGRASGVRKRVYDGAGRPVEGVRLQGFEVCGRAGGPSPSSRR